MNIKKTSRCLQLKIGGGLGYNNISQMSYSAIKTMNSDNIVVVSLLNNDYRRTVV